jgi:hypothetical protein
MLRRLINVLMILTTVVAGAAELKGQHPRIKAEAERITGDRFTVTTRTPRGAFILSFKQPSQEMLAAIDRGLTDLFALARKNRYFQRLNYSEYTIYIAKPDRTKDQNGRYSPDLAVPADQYAGTDYDQGGFVYAAGMVVAFRPMAFIIAEHTREFDRVADVVRYEGEHLILYHNDRPRYEATKDHSRGGAHPILKFQR